MKRILLFAIALLISSAAYSQELSADDRVTITQSAKPYIGVYAFGYQGLPTPGFPQFQLNNYGGVPGTPLATADNSTLGMFAFSGHNGSAKKTVGIIRVKSMDNFASALSSRMDFLIGPNREQRMTILGDSGYVGIGTTSPTNQLDVDGNIRMRTGATAGYIPVADADGVMTWTDPYAIFPDDPPLWYQTGSGIANSFGNVGIGTNSTSTYKLLVDAGNETTAIRVTGNHIYGTYFTFENESTGGIPWNLISTGQLNGEGAGKLLFHTDEGIGSSATKMTLEREGNLGIGTFDPTQRLDVDGNIRMRTGAMAGYIPVADANGVMTWTDPNTITTAADTDWLTDGDGELYRTDGVYIGSGLTSPDGHTLNVHNNQLGKAAIRGVNQSSTGFSVFAEGQLALQNFATNPAGLPLDVNNVGVFGKINNVGDNAAAVYGWNNDDEVDNYSGIFIADGLASSGTNYGLYASAQNGLDNWAGYFAQGGVHINDHVRIGTTASSPYKLLLDAGNDIEVMKATGNNVFGSYFTLQNESAGGIPWNLISTGQFNGEGAGKLLFHTSSAIGSSGALMTLEREGHLGIGTIDPVSKLHVVDDTLNAANQTILAISNRNSNSMNVIEAAYIQTGNFDGAAIRSFAGAVEGYGYGLRTESGFVGVYAQTHGGAFDSPLSLFGSFSRCTGSAGLRKGVYGRAENTGGDAYGGDFVGEAGSTGKTAYGIKGYANHFEQGLSYGVYADHDGGDTGYSLYINGQGFATSGGILASDERFKKDVEEVKGALDIINDLQPKTYSFRQDGEFAKLNFDDKLQYGFIAQELEEVLPNAVHDVDVVFSDSERQAELSNPENKGKEIEDNTYTKEYKGVNYTALIPVLTQGIKELTAENEALKSSNEELESELSNVKKQLNELAELMNSKFNQIEEDMSSCCLNETDNRTGNTNIELNGSDIPSLEQNAPNPFHKQTIIKFYIPSSAQKAIMTITDIKGSSLKSINLEETGFGTVTINANELPVGTYIYTLYVDGKQIESKQMVLVK